MWLGVFEQITGSFQKKDVSINPKVNDYKPCHSGVKPLKPYATIVKQDFLIISDCLVKNAEAWSGKRWNQPSKIIIWSAREEAGQWITWVVRPEVMAGTVAKMTDRQYLRELDRDKSVRSPGFPLYVFCFPRGVSEEIA